MVDKPNLTFPLAASYNERGIAGFTNTVTNGLDQRKVNSMYELVKNSVTGKATLYLVKRPGTAIANASYGVTGQVAYLVSKGAGLFGGDVASQWVFSVSGTDVRASNSGGTTTVILTAASTVPSIVDKTAISGTDTLVLQTYNTGSGAQRFWFSSAIATFTEITDGDFTGLSHQGKAEFLDGYMFVLDRTSKAIYNSDLNSLANWTASNYITKQIKQDTSIGLIKFGKQILAFGNESVEGFVNNGNPTGSPLISAPQLSSNVGLILNQAAYGHYYAQVKDKIYFRGRIGTATQHSVIAYNGQTFEKVSTPAIDKILNMNGAYSVDRFSCTGVYGVSFALDPVTATTQRWLVFFPDWNEWFEWNSTVFCPVGNGIYQLGVGANQHKIYLISSTADNWQDEGTDYTWTHQFQLPSDGNQRKFMPYMALKGDTARSAQSISVQFSDDDGQNWSSARTIDMTGTQKSLFRNGSFRGARQVRLFHAGNTEVRLSQFLAKIE